MKRTLLMLSGLLSIAVAYSQEKDSSNILPGVKVVGYKSMNGIGHVDTYAGQIIFAGKKNELLTIDSLDANKALNNTRQVIGRVPGVSISETESSGFTANGIAFRGLNPYQSIEMNTRQNGYNISADIFGYNESYYLPPMEAVQSIQLVRGSSSLQFGPQIGGVINYVLKEAPALPFQATVAQTAGSYGMYNAYSSVGGTLGKLKYFGYGQFRTLDGWRDNSDQKQISGFGKISYDFSPKLQASIEYTLLRNKIHMPGGLTDEQFEENPKQSTRERNWLESPWNVLAAKLNYVISNKTSLQFTSSYLFSQRNLVWRNEDGWPYERDSITPDLTYVPRELEREYFKSSTNELRLLTNYKLGKQNNTIAYGIRFAYADMKKLEHAEGSTGTDFDLTTYSDYEEQLHYQTTNVAAFAENIFNIGKKLSITPGLRLEYLKTTVNGVGEDEDEDDVPLKINNESNNRVFVLAGIGAQYNLTHKVNAYANYSQSYRPITYSDLTPFGSISKVDPDLKDASADNFDIGVRGQIKTILNFDVSFFYLNYDNRVGMIEKTDANGETYSLRTNTGSSEHKGIETYAEINISKFLFPNAKLGKLSLYNSLALVDAKYTKGEYKGNYVEYAPKTIERVGMNYYYKGFAVNAQYSYHGSSFGDAGNTVFSEDALVGEIPAYNVVDLSASYRWSQYKFSFGINNLTNNKYFTLRTDEYPGPGIIPATARMFYGGFTLSF